MFTPSKHNASVQINSRTAYVTLDSVRVNEYPCNNAMTARDLKWQLGASFDRMIHTPQVKNRQLNSTSQDALTGSPQLDFTVTDDESIVNGYPVPLPNLKAMKSHYPSLHHSKPGESPAKAFAKLKAKVQSEQIRANEGIQTKRDMCSGVREKGGAAFNSPRRGKENKWTIGKVIEQQRQLDLQYDEAEALTLSPTCSPRKGLTHPLSEFSSNHLQSVSPVKGLGPCLDPRHRCTPTKNPVLDVFPLSPRMALSHPLQMKSKQVQRPPAPVRDYDDFEMPKRGPEQGQSPSLVSTDDDLGRDVSEGHDDRSAFPSFLMSSTKMHGHIEERKRSREQQAVYKVSSSTTKELRNGGHSCPPQDKPTSTTLDMYEMEEDDTCMDAFGRVAGNGFPVIQSGMNREAVDCQLEIDPDDDGPPPAVKRRPVLAEDRPLHDSPRTSNSIKKAYVSLELLSPMTPSKIFARMKEKERRRQQQQEEVYKVSSSSKELRNGGHSWPQQNKPTSTTFDMEEEDHAGLNACGSPQKSALPVNQSEMIPSRLETVDSQSEIDPSDDVLPPAVKSHTVLIEDPLVINSPQICFPKKREAVFRHEEPSGSKHKQEAKVMGIYLKHWVLKSNRSGLYVDGMRRDNCEWWHSNIIAVRVSSSVLKTVSGSTYILIGKMNMEAGSTLPTWFLKKFLFGFPQRWKQFYKQVLTESKGMEADSQIKKRGRREWPVSEKPATSLSLKQHVMTSALCPPASCPPAPFSVLGGIKQSRSGRMIRPPLEYWRGGRTVLDADMNITVYTCYETTVCEPPDDTPVSRRASKKSQKPMRVFSPCNDGHRQSEVIISGNDVLSAPVRKVKKTRQHRNRAGANPDESSSNQIDLPEEPLTCHNKSPAAQYRSFRSRKSSSPRHPFTETVSNTDNVTLCQVRPHGQTQQRSNKLNCQGDASARQERVRRKPQHFPAPPEPPSVFDVVKKKRTYQRKSQKPSNSHEKSKPDQKVIQQSEEQRDAEKTSDTNGRFLRKGVAAVKSRKAQNMGCDIVVVEEEEEESQSNNSSNQKRGGRRSSRRRVRRVIEDTESEPSQLSLSSQSLNSLVDSGKASRKSGTKKKLTAGKPKKTPPPKPTPKPTQIKTKSSKGNGKVNPSTVVPQEEEDEEEWTERELARLQEAVSSCPKHVGRFWMKVAAMVGTRSAEECQKQYTSHETFLAPIKNAKKKEAPNKEAESPKITARAGTLKRKLQVRQLLEAIPKDDHDDIFSSTPMQKKRFQLPTESPSGKEHSFFNSAQDPLSPGSTGFAIVKTPQNLHVTPGMMGSVNRNEDDKITYQLQKRMKKSQAAVHKHASFSKKFSPTPSVKRTLRRCDNTENDAFIIWKMFPENNEALDESGEEDYYFTDD